jgi:hypothetical protein
MLSRRGYAKQYTCRKLFSTAGVGHSYVIGVALYHRISVIFVTAVEVCKSFERVPSLCSRIWPRELLVCTSDEILFEEESFG